MLELHYKLFNLLSNECQRSPEYIGSETLNGSEHTYHALSKFPQDKGACSFLCSLPKLAPPVASSLFCLLAPKFTK